MRKALYAMFTALLLVVTAAVAENTIPLEERLEMLQLRMWDAINSTDPNSVGEFQALLEEIGRIELAIEQRGDVEEPAADPVIVEKIIKERVEVPVIQRVEVEVPVETIVYRDRTIEVPVEKIVEKERIVYVEKPVPAKPVLPPKSTVITDPHAPKRVIVDRATFTMAVFQGDQQIETQRVVIGKKGRRTPAMRSKITHVVLNPYWNVTPRIATVDLAAEFLNNPTTMDQDGFEVLKSWREDAPRLDPLAIDWASYNRQNLVPYLVRQKPGPYNRVGRIKFVVEKQGPETNGIMLHGSSDRERYQFNEDDRQFSSGCVRVEHEVRLAKLVLNGGNGYSEDYITGIMNKGKTKWIKLKKPVALTIR